MGIEYVAQISSNYKGWLIVVAIGLSMVALGAIADFLVKKDEIKWLHGKFFKLSEALMIIPLREWQVRIARAGIHVVDSVQRFTITSLVFPVKLFQGIFTKLPRLNDDKCSLMIISLCTLLFLETVLALTIPQPSYFHLNIWLLGIFIVLRYYDIKWSILLIYVCVALVVRLMFGLPLTLLPIWLLGSFIVLLIIRFEDFLLLAGAAIWMLILIPVEMVWTNVMRGATVTLFVYCVFPIFIMFGVGIGSILRRISSRFLPAVMVNAVIISIFMTSIALIITFRIPYAGESYFYISSTSSFPSILLRMLLLYPFNYLFDLVTILVSIALLRFVINRKHFIGLVAILDIAISAILTIILLSFLLLIENGWDISRFHVYLAESVDWFGELIIGIYQAIKDNEPVMQYLAWFKNFHLLPVLLTTFVPVVLYMSVFILISFSKPVLWLASRIFGVMGEKEELVFKQFGFLIAAIMAAVKAIYEVLTL
ncbi:MAG TPA: hypothetical protein VMW72_01875 [Sedimentisphaerales bacterium]|nr:hypothetical protein [Sedimentisphaerales bacterium]